MLCHYIGSLLESDDTSRVSDSTEANCRPVKAIHVVLPHIRTSININEWPSSLPPAVKRFLLGSSKGPPPDRRFRAAARRSKYEAVKSRDAIVSIAYFCPTTAPAVVTVIVNNVTVCVDRGPFRLVSRHCWEE